MHKLLLKKGIFMSKKVVCCFVVAAFIFTLVPVPPVLALRNPQAKNAPAVGRTLGDDIQIVNNTENSSQAAAIGRQVPKGFTDALSKNSLYNNNTKALFRMSGLTNLLLYELAKDSANYKGAELDVFINDKGAVSELLKETVDVLQSDVYKGICDIFTGAYGWPKKKLNEYVIHFAHQRRVGLKEFLLGLVSPDAQKKFTPEFVKEKYVGMEPDVVVLGGGHGAASTTDMLRREGYTVAVGVNAGDWGGGSWKLKKAISDAWGLWITMPGDYTNVLGIGFSEADQPAIAYLLNSRFPKINGRFEGTMKQLFIDTITAEVKKENIKVNSQVLTFISFCLGIAAEMDNALDNDVFNYTDKNGKDQNVVSENSLQNFLHAGTMIYTGAYRKRVSQGAANVADPDKFLVGSYLLEKAVGAKSGRIMPGYFEGADYTRIFTRHAGQPPTEKEIMGGVNVILEGAKNPRSRYARWVKDPRLARLTDYRLFPAPEANPALIEEINRCKMVVIAPGNTYESVFTTLYTRGVPQALKRAKEDGRPVVWVLNPVGLLFTYGYTIEDYVEALKKVIASATNRNPQSFRLGEYISYMLINNPKEPEAEQVLEEAMDKFKEIRDTDSAGYAKVSFREPLGTVGEDTTDKHLIDLLITKEGLVGFKFGNFLSPQIKKVTIRSVEIKQATYGRELVNILNSQYGQSSARANGELGPVAIFKAVGEAAMVIGPKIPQEIINGFRMQGFELNKGLFIAQDVPLARAILAKIESQFKIVYKFNYTGGGITVDTEDIETIPISTPDEIAAALENARASAQGVRTEV